MSNAVSNNVSRKKLQQLLSAIGSNSADETEQIESAEYNWHQPHHFSSRELEKLDDFTKEAAAMLSEKFTNFCHGGFDVTVAAITQHFADELLGQTPEDKWDNYDLAFGVEKELPCGIVSIPAQTATFLVTQLLGDSESEESSDKVLSELEQSLLLDLACVVVETLSTSYDNRDLRPVGSIVKGRPSLELQGMEELCKISFNIKQADSEDSFEAHVLMFCDTLDPVVGGISQADGGFQPDDISKAILESLQETHVTISAKLGSAMLSFEEVTALQPGDILLLDKGVDEPVELTVEGRTLFRGQPAKSTGKYAVVIAELSDREYN